MLVLARSERKPDTNDKEFGRAGNVAWIGIFIVVVVVPSALSSCEEVQCPVLNCNGTKDQAFDLGSECCLMCAAKSKEKCGGDANTPCREGMVCKYRLGMIVGEGKAGICEPGKCRRVVCSYRQICEVTSRGSRPQCTCSHFKCRGKVNTVCGHDGKDYISICALQHEECKQRRFIGLNHVGPCKIPPPTPAIPKRKPGPEDKYLKKIERLSRTVPFSTDFDGQFSDQLAMIRQLSNPYPDCNHNDEVVDPFEIIPFEEGNPCCFVKCDPFSGKLIELKVFACGNNSHEVDYNVTSRSIHGGWSAWSAWSEDCEGSCLNGTRIRFRMCDDPLPSNEGRTCKGADTSSKPCVPEECGFNCTYGEWSDWSECSTTCETGVQTRTRPLLYDVPEVHPCIISETGPCGDDTQTCNCQRRLLGRGIVNNTDNTCYSLYNKPLYRCSGQCACNHSLCVANSQEVMGVFVCPKRYTSHLEPLGPNASLFDYHHFYYYWAQRYYEVIKGCECQAQNETSELEWD